MNIFCYYSESFGNVVFRLSPCCTCRLDSFGYFPGVKFCWPTFRKTLSFPFSKVRMRIVGDWARIYTGELTGLSGLSQSRAIGPLPTPPSRPPDWLRPLKPFSSPVYIRAQSPTILIHTFENGNDRVFRNVGQQNLTPGKYPKESNLHLEMSLPRNRL
jgi:hypothetical protein